MFTYGSSGVATLANIIMFALGVLALGFQGFGLIDAIRRPTNAFVAAEKQTKQLWLILLGVATAIGFVSVVLIGALNFFNLLAVVVAGVYLTDVRPALQRMSGGGGNPGGYW